MDEFKQEIRRYFQNSLISLMSRDNLSQVDLAALIGVTQLTIRNWELGNYKPTPERLPAIEEAYKIPIANIII